MVLVVAGVTALNAVVLSLVAPSDLAAAVYLLTVPLAWVVGRSALRLARNAVSVIRNARVF